MRTVIDLIALAIMVFILALDIGNASGSGIALDVIIVGFIVFELITEGGRA